MKTEDLKKHIDNYKQSLSEIHRRRDSWSSEIKSLISEVLTNIKKEFDLDWNVYVNDSIQNLESIELTFGNMPSGLIRKTNSVTTSYSKIGGSLVFSQGYNGLVYVIIFYPSIEQIVETNPNQKVLKRIEPNEIGSGFIRQRIAEFLDEISDWENTANSKSIGYK